MSHLSILTKKNLTSILDKLGDDKYRESWKKAKLTAHIENYDVDTYVAKMSSAQLKIVLEEAGESTSGKISTLRNRFKKISTGGTTSRNSSTSSSSTNNTNSSGTRSTFTRRSNTTPGLTYTVAFRNGNFTCECKGFEYRGTCSHVDSVRKQLEESGGMIDTRISNRNHFPGKVKCLLIGNASYTGSPLPNSDNDAKQMNKVLKGLGHSTTLLIDANRKKMDSTIEKIEANLSDKQGVLVYFSGHGCEIQGVSHMMPIENARDRRSGSDAYGINIDQLIERFSSAAFRIFIIDACRSDIDEVALSGNKQASVNTLQWYATSEATVAYAGFGDTSPFTSTVLEELKVKEHIIDIAMSVQCKVLNTHGLMQIPEVTTTMTRKWFPNYR